MLYFQGYLWIDNIKCIKSVFVCDNYLFFGKFIQNCVFYVHKRNSYILVIVYVSVCVSVCMLYAYFYAPESMIVHLFLHGTQ